MNIACDWIALQAAVLHMLIYNALVQTQDKQFRQRETALTAAEHKIELLRTRLENDVSTTQKAAQAVEADRSELKVRICLSLRLTSFCSTQTTSCITMLQASADNLNSVLLFTSSCM